MKLIKYNTDSDPEEIGVYACRVPMYDSEMLYEDIFLFWYKDRWERCGSDQRYRGKVTGWIGPLQRTVK